MNRKLSAAATKRRRAADNGIAPNAHHFVVEAMNEHPEVNRMGEDNERGKIIDYACLKANGGKATPWGRKSRQRPGADMMPVNPNGDGMCYLRPDGKFEIYDAISGIDGGATWDFAGVFDQGENGFWSRANGTPDIEIETHRYIGGGNDTGDCDQCHRPKGDRVHAVPEGKVKHQPWQGEDGKGDCDLCMKPVSDSIHSVVFEPPTRPGIDANGVLRDPKAFFLSLAGVREGDPFPRWKEVLQQMIDAGASRNVVEGRKPKRTDPFYGIGVMVDASGPRGRLFLPAAVPQVADDGTRWFTRDVQVIADMPGATPGVGPFKLEWREWGSPYVPIQEIDPGSGEPGNGGGNGEEPEAGLTTRVTVLEAAVAALGARVEAVEGGGDGSDPAGLDAAIAAALKDLRIEVDVVPAGPKVQVPRALRALFGGITEVDLNHDHSVNVKVTLDGREIARTKAIARTFAAAVSNDSDTSHDEAVRDSADAEGEA